MAASIKIGNKNISKGAPAFIIAEISANHAQNFQRAVTLIKEAKKCGADAVKFQTYTPDIHTLDVDSRYFRIKHPKWGGQTLYELYKKTFTPWDWFKKLKKIADDAGIIFFSSVADKTGIDFLAKIGVPAYKISSFELVDLRLIGYAARTHKPLIMSTGMANVSEIKDAVSAARKGGAKDIILLKCVSSYPARPQEMNLKTIPHMAKMFGCPVGISDHTLGIGICVASVSLGARVIEKHFTLSRKISTPDSFFSIEPKEFKELVLSVREAEKALGKVHYGLTLDEKRSRIFRRSLFVVQDVKKGELFTEANVRSIRPAYGILPKYLDNVLGKKAKRSIRKGTPLTPALVS